MSLGRPRDVDSAAFRSELATAVKKLRLEHRRIERKAIADLLFMSVDGLAKKLRRHGITIRDLYRL